jgi:hypothetical protein
MVRLLHGTSRKIEKRPLRIAARRTRVLLEVDYEMVREA